MATLLVEDSDLRAFARVLAKLFGVQFQDDAAALSGLITNLQQQVQTMSDKLSTQLDASDATIDRLVDAVGSLEQRAAANDQKLAAAEAARDQAVADLATTKTTLDQVNAELAAMQNVDTSSQEARLQAESTKVQGAIDRLNAIDVTPAPAPAPTDTGSNTGVVPPATAGTGDSSGSTTDAGTGSTAPASGADTTGGSTTAPPGTGTAL